MRSFGPKGKATPPAERHPFEFTVIDEDEEPVTHQFQAVARTDIAALVLTLSSTDKHPERSLSGMMALIAKMLDNKDGVPVNWRPTPLPPAATENRPDDADQDDDGTPKFRGPDGKLYPMADAPRFTDTAAGSSKRRWLELMDSDVIVDAKDLTDLFAWLVGLAAKRPTPPPS